MTYLVVQCLRCCTPNAEDPGLILGFEIFQFTRSTKDPACCNERSYVCN